MKRILLPVMFAVLTLTALLAVSCGKDKEVEVPVYYLYRDIIGNAEFEADGDYPPPANLDNYSDDLITVTLHFAEAYLGGRDNGGFDKDDIYGYYITTDDGEINFVFPFAPRGPYWASAELVVNDTCYFAKTDEFYHSGDTANTFIEIRPTLLGTGKGCFDLILSSAPDQPVEYVQTGPRTWISKDVYDRYYKQAETEANSVLQP